MTLVILFAAIATVAVLAPGPIVLGLAALALLVLVVALLHRGMAHAVLGLLASISPPIEWALQYDRRRMEYEDVVRNMSRTLEHFGLPKLAEETVDELCHRPPNDARDYVVSCARSVAEVMSSRDLRRERAPSQWWRRLIPWRRTAESEVPEARAAEGGEAGEAAAPSSALDVDDRAALLELLYRGSQGMATVQLRSKMSGAQLDELAGIIAKSGRVPAVEDGARRVALIRWVLDRCRDFSMETVEKEIHAFTAVWVQLSAFAGSLEGVGIEARPDLDTLREAVAENLAGGTSLAPEASRIAREILLARAAEWIRAWIVARQVARPETRVPPEDEIRDLAAIAVGFFAAEGSPVPTPWLAGLCDEVRHRPRAIEILLGYLWRRSRVSEGDGAGADLAGAIAEWSQWSEQAKSRLHVDVARQLLTVLKGELAKHVWPTWLPIQQTIAEVVQQSERIYRVLEKLVEHREVDEVWRGRIKEVLRWTGKPMNATAELTPEKIVEAARKAFEERLGELVPGSPPRALQTPRELEHELERFAEEFRPEARLMSYLGDYASVFETLALFQERSGELAHQLAGLAEALRAEAGGGSAYLITFDQLRGGLADVIDSLKGRYGFENYTRYSRVGLLQAGETFEGFYRAFEADLEARLREVLETRNVVWTPAGHGEWEQVEITVQQISLFHRHDFVTDAEKSLMPKLTDVTFRKVFKVPPSTVEALNRLSSAGRPADEARIH